MNTQENRDKLAKAMGWSRRYNRIRDRDYWVLKDEGIYDFIVSYDDWNPYTSGDHCFMLLDRLDELNLNHCHHRTAIQDFEFSIVDSDWETLMVISASDLKTAICNAILQLLEERPEVFK